ncbi:MAG: hypothetical protein AMJ81_04630 [Phycisphaerae bacterium SM23_33]|nr:MAG: hypothetical protein AMJ81_04630 [Phycisphaerae bacterium SM23_33]
MWPALSAKARLSLSQLSPPLARPVNAADWDKLPDEVAPAVRQGEQLIEKGQHARALAPLEEARKLAPQSPRILRALGRAYAGLRNAEKAKQFLEQSAAAAPDSVCVQHLLGQCAVHDNDADQALRHFRTALLCSDAVGENPDTAQAVFLLAGLLKQQGYLKAAAEAFANLGDLLYAHGRAYAQRPLLAVLATHPERALLAEGKLLLELGETARAAVVLERAYRRNKTDDDAGLLAVQALVAKGDFDRAESILMEMLQERQLRPVIVRAALALCDARNDPAVPLRLLRAQLAGEETSWAFVAAMAEAAAQRGAGEQAAKMLSRHLVGSPADRAAAAQLARLYARMGDVAAAVKGLAGLLADEEAEFARVKDELARLARTGLKAEFIEGLAAEAEKADAELRPAILCVAGMLAAQSDQPALAVKLLREALKADAKFWPAYEALEEVHVAAGDFDAVDALIRELVAAAGESYFRFYLVGKSQLDRGQVAAAAESLEQARTRKARHLPTLLLLGRAHLLRGNFREAERLLLAAFAVDRRSAAAVRQLQDLYAVTHRPAQARMFIERFLRDDPKSIPGRIMLGRHYHLTYQADLAWKTVRELLAEAPDDVEVRLLELEVEMPALPAGAPIPADQAEALMKKARHVLSLDGRNERAGMLYAALLANQGRHAEAAKALEPFHSRHPRDDRIAEAYFKALLKAQMRQQALRRIQEVADMKSLPAAMRQVVLDCLLEMKEFDKAEAYAQKWLDDPTDESRPEVRWSRTLEVYKQAKHYDKALALLDKWIAASSRAELLPLLRREKVRLFAQAKRYDDAIDYVKKWRLQDAGSEAPKIALISALREAKAYERALPVLDEFIGEGGDDNLLEVFRGAKLECYAELGRFDELMRFAKAWIAQEPDSARPGRAAVAELVTHKQYEKALEIATQALERVERSDPSAKGWAEDLEQARALVVQILLAAERKKEALERAEAAVKAAPKDAAALRLLAGVLAAMEKEAEYVAMLEKIYQLDPGNDSVNNDLGYSWADRGINLEQAESMIRKALAQRPDEIAFRDSLGWVLYKQGKFREAGTVFQGVTDAEEQELHPIILDHAGDTYWRLGMKEMAFRLWARAVALAEKGEHKGREARNVLKNTPRKIADGKKGKPPNVAPLGKGLSEPPGL